MIRFELDAAQQKKLRKVARHLGHGNLRHLLRCCGTRLLEKTAGPADARLSGQPGFATQA